MFDKFKNFWNYCDLKKRRGRGFARYGLIFTCIIGFLLCFGSIGFGFFRFSVISCFLCLICLEVRNLGFVKFIIGICVGLKLSNVELFYMFQICWNFISTPTVWWNSWMSFCLCLWGYFCQFRFLLIYLLCFLFNLLNEQDVVNFRWN